MDYGKMWDALAARARTDVEYQQCLGKLKALESGYIRLRDSLEPEQQRRLDDYIIACEELGDRMAILAYRIGLEK